MKTEESFSEKVASLKRIKHQSKGALLRLNNFGQIFNWFIQWLNLDGISNLKILEIIQLKLPYSYLIINALCNLISKNQSTKKINQTVEDLS